MFIGRQRELARLNEMYESGNFECAVVYGRRRVGKTALIQEFIKNKKAVYYSAIESSQATNLENFSYCICGVCFPGISNPPVYKDFASAFETIGDLAVNERLILVIDEYPYLASAAPDISSVLQNVIDRRLLNTQVFLILCGSSMSFMEYQVLGYKSPLYGRRTAQFKIEPFDFFESVLFNKGFNIYDNAVIYGITGGVPLYLNKMNDKKTLAYNITKSFFEPASYLFEEPSNLLKQELREPQVYNDIITAVANGASRLNEISGKARLETSVCSKYITALIALGIIKKETSVLQEKTRKTIYRLNDSMFRFWYRFVPRHTSQIQFGMGDTVYKTVRDEIPAYMGEVFEEICKQYLWKQNIIGGLPFVFRDAGRWWGNNPLTKREQEIDIIAYGDNKAIFCECKWTEKHITRAVLDGLIEKSLMFDFEEKYYFLFSKSGFAKDCADTAAAGGIRLIAFADMV